MYYLWNNHLIIPQKDGVTKQRLGAAVLRLVLLCSVPVSLMILRIISSFILRVMASAGVLRAHQEELAFWSGQPCRPHLFWKSPLPPILGGFIHLRRTSRNATWFSEEHKTMSKNGSQSLCSKVGTRQSYQTPFLCCFVNLKWNNEVHTRWVFWLHQGVQ